MSDEENNLIKSTVRWACFIDDPNILKSSNRDELKKYLEQLLAGLNQRYTSQDAKAFPSNLELDRLTNVIKALAKTLGKTKTGIDELFSAMKRIENRWNNMPLISFADDLLERLLKSPLSPWLVVYQASKTNTNIKGALDEIKVLLSGKSEPVVKSATWENCFTAIQSLVFPGSRLLTSTEPNLFKTEFSNGHDAQKKLLSYLLFMDLRRQQLEWQLKYGKQVEASLVWLYLLLRPKDYQKLTNVFPPGLSLSPEEIHNKTRILMNRERKNRSDRKSRLKNHRITEA